MNNWGLLTLRLTKLSRAWTNAIILCVERRSRNTTVSHWKHALPGQPEIASLPLFCWFNRRECQAEGVSANMTWHVAIVTDADDGLFGPVPNLTYILNSHNTYTPSGGYCYTDMECMLGSCHEKGWPRLDPLLVLNANQSLSRSPFSIFDVLSGNSCVCITLRFLVTT